MSDRGGWKNYLIGEIAELNPRRPSSLQSLDNETPVTFVPMASVCEHEGAIKQSIVRPFVEVRKGFTWFAERDVIFAKITPCMQNGKTAIARGLTNGIGFGSTEFHVIRPSPLVLPEWIYYFVRQHSFRAEAAKNFRGSAGQQRVPEDFLAKQIVPVPDLETQSRIVARIQDCFRRLEEMEQLQEELDFDLERITDASVRQLADELRSEHPSLTIGQIVTQDPGAMRSGPFGSAMKHDEFVSEGHLVIGIANVQENRFDPVRKWMISDAKFEVMRRYSVEPGDVLITIMGTIGRTCVVPSDIGSAITSKHVYRIRFPKKRVNPHYVSYLINFDSKTREQLFGTAAGGVMPGLNANKLRDLSIPLPPIKVQDRMVEQLDRTHAALQETRSLHSVSDLTHLRSAILREAFAGRL